ncbi:MmyB family transcriptional regulator [Pseudomonas sp. NCHU5208]|uniref:helix-turn-helix domain-containing protein n=1 Tax=unclassified Pseudomonas TaxID=196821 RepID=UPI003F9D2264
MNAHLPPRTPALAPAGLQLRQLRRQAGLSQLNLGLICGISQRHLSCIETGRARPSPATLHALLMALEAPLEQCNSLFLAAGYAPRYGTSPLEAQSLAAIRDAIGHILHANNPAPAIVLGSQWQVLAANASTAALFDLLGLSADSADELNLLVTLLQPGGLGDHLVNADEIRALAWQRASREALQDPELARLLAGLPAPCAPAAVHDELPPLVMTRIDSPEGPLSFLSTFTTFGMPLDITVASLRIEHLIPADPHTWRVMTQAYERSQAAPA